LFGYERDGLEGLPIEALVPVRFRRDHEAHRESYATYPQPREIGSGVELFGLRKDGTEFPADISLSPLETAEGTFVSSSIRDVAALGRAEYLASHMVAMVESSH